MKKILAILLSLSMCMGLCTQVNAVDKNYVLNGDFSQGTENWEINKKDNTDGTIDVLNQELKFVPLNCNGNYWELGFKQANIQLKNGVKYRLSFEAKASEETNIKVTVENQENWTKRLNDTDTWLTQDYKMYTYEFNVSDDGLSQLVYHIGENSNNNKEYFFKNISITEIPVQKLDSWILNEANGVSGTLSGTEDKVQVKINAVNGNWWDLTLKKDNIELQPKKMYKVNFDVISSMDGTMSFDIENTNDYNIKALDRTLLDLKTGKNQFEFNFTKKNTEKESLAFHLSSGDGNTDLTNANITIENIKFTELEDLGNEYVFNGGFENGITGWEFYNNNGADLKISAESQEGVLTFDSSQGNDYWDAQFFQKDIMLDNGVYEVSFDIKANQEGRIKFNIQDTSDYNLKYLDEQELNLTVDYQTMEFKFSIKSNDLLGTTKNAKIQFDVGKYNDFVLKKIYIDNVKIEKIGNVDVDDLEKGEVHFDVNDIITKDFKGLGV